MIRSYCERTITTKDQTLTVGPSMRFGARSSAMLLAQRTRANGGGNHFPDVTTTFGTYVRKESENGCPSADGSQLDSATPDTGVGPMPILREPSASKASDE